MFNQLQILLGRQMKGSLSPMLSEVILLLLEVTSFLKIKIEM